MGEKLKETISIPKWVVILFVTTIIGIFSTGWVKVDRLEKELAVEKTSRFYMEKKLDIIEVKIDKITDILRGK